MAWRTRPLSTCIPIVVNIELDLSLPGLSRGNVILCNEFLIDSPLNNQNLIFKPFEVYCPLVMLIY